MRIVTFLLPLCLLFPVIHGCSKMETGPAEPPLPSLSITAPVTGDVWSAGSSCAIVWQSDGLDNDTVRIDLHHDSGIVETLADAVPDSGIWSLTLPLHIPTGTRYYVTITALSDGRVSGTSGTFTIVNYHDGYEPDSSASSATRIDTDGTQQQHTLARDDADWFRFNAVSGVTYCVQTFGTTDTYLRLYTMQTADSLVLLASDNDAGIGSNALIVWTCASSGTGYFAVSGNTRSNSLPYSVALSAGRAVLMITSPYEGSALAGGKSASIEWAHSSNSGDTVSLHLYRNDSLSRTIIHGAPNDGFYTWAVPSTVPSSPRYRIKITGDNDTSINNYSGYFTIMNNPWSITVNSPAGLSAWNTGSSYYICWTTAGNPGCCASIALFHDTSRIMTAVDVVTLADGCYRWQVPKTLPGSSRYRFKITGIADSSVCDFSESFTIVNIPDSLTVTSPGAAATWKSGTVDTIRWISTGNPGPLVRIDLFNGAVPAGTIATGAVQTGEGGYYCWSIPVTLPGSSQYRIKITCTADTSFSDFSDTFTIASIPSTITVTAPEAATVWNAGSACTINWTSSGPVGDALSIGLYRDSTLVQLISSMAPDSGRFQFQLSPALGGVNRYRIRIQSVTRPSVTGFSGWFTVVPVPVSVTVTTPTALSSWITGNTYSLYWSSSGPPGSMVSIDLYDSSKFIRTISALESASSNSSQWTVPLSLHTSDQYRIKISSTSVDTVFDFSDPFTITHLPASITVSAPAAGASWNAGTTHSIAWNSSVNVPGNFVTLDLYDSTAFVATISSGTGRAAGAYSWALPATLKGGPRHRIRIRCAADSSVYAFSGDFTIVQQPNTLTITAPTSASSWSAGSYYTIYWSYTGTPGPSVKLDLYDSSAFVHTISQGAYTAGTSFLWLVPPSLPAGGNYRILIRSAAMDTALDFSDYFSITNSVVNDAYEPDSAFSIATPIAKSSPAENHILTMSDQDWFSLTAVSGATYIIETLGATDTYMDLFSTNGTTLLLSDDDSGSQFLNAKIVWTPATGGTYFFRVKGSAGAVGSYSVTVR